MNIRGATINDYEPVMSLYNGLVGEDRYTNHDRDSYHKIIKAASNGVFVAELDDRIIGVASVSIRSVIRYPQPIAELDELYVADEARDHGVGKSLMTTVEAFARQQNCYRLYIESGYQHEGGHKFYEKLGYTNYGYHFLKNL